MAFKGMPVWTVWYVEAFPPLVALSLLMACRWGATTELLTALVFVVATDLQKAAAGRVGVRFDHFEALVAIVDISAFLAFALLARHHPKRWLLGIAALQFVACLAHVAKVFQPGMPALVYEILMGSTGYPLLILLWVGIARAGRHSRIDRPISAAHR